MRARSVARIPWPEDEEEEEAVVLLLLPLLARSLPPSRTVAG
jgi:hypothetical protein